MQGYCRIGSLEICAALAAGAVGDHCRTGRLENSQCEIWELFHFHSSIRDAKIYMMNDGDNIVYIPVSAFSSQFNLIYL